MVAKINIWKFSYFCEANLIKHIRKILDLLQHKYVTWDQDEREYDGISSGKAITMKTDRDGGCERESGKIIKSIFLRKPRAKVAHRGGDGGGGNGTACVVLPSSFSSFNSWSPLLCTEFELERISWREFSVSLSVWSEIVFALESLFEMRIHR